MTDHPVITHLIGTSEDGREVVVAVELSDGREVTVDQVTPEMWATIGVRVGENGELQMVMQ